MGLKEFSFLLWPEGGETLTTFYFCWMLIFLIVHFVWDWRSSKTPVFCVDRLKDRGVQTVYNASTFATSLLLLLALIHNSVVELLGDTSIPLLIAGFSGIIQSAIAIVPPKSPVN